MAIGISIVASNAGMNYVLVAIGFRAPCKPLARLVLTSNQLAYGTNFPILVSN